METPAPASDGLLLVDKPAGITSHDAVDAVRRSLATRRVGHAGTLDPFATGLLVMMVGRATRLLSYVDGDPKVYAASIQFGAETDTDDLTGTLTRHATPPRLEAVVAGIASLTGDIMQTPPAYSAKQVGGRRAYAAARRGAPLELKPVPVRVHRWELLDYDGQRASVIVECGGGTYVRALARDLGRLAGSAAHLTSLRRTRSGACRVEDAVPLAEVQTDPSVVRSPLPALGAIPTVSIDEASAARVARGIRIPASGEASRVALVDEAGQLVAIVERTDDRWQPRVVVRDG